MNESSLDDLLEKKGLSVTRNHRNKRKASNPQQLRASTAFVGADDEDDEVNFFFVFSSFEVERQMLPQNKVVELGFILFLYLICIFQK